MDAEKYLSASPVKRRLMKIGDFFGRLFGGIAKIPQAVKTSSKTAILSIVSIFVSGFGFLFQRQVLKGLVRIALQALFIFYLVRFGVSNFSGADNLDYLNMQMVACILTALFVLLHLTALSGVVKTQLEIEAGNVPQAGFAERKLKEWSNGASNLNHRLKKAFVKGNRLPIALSFLFTGLPQIFQGQIIKGILLFLLEAAFAVYIALRGVMDLTALFTLQVKGIKSDFGLVYGVLCLILIAAFITLYLASFSNVLGNAEKKSQGVKLNSFMADIKLMLDRKFYITSLFLPVLGVVALTVIPLIFMILIAFTNYSSALGDVIPTDKKFLSWVGFDNFVNLLSMGENLKTFLSVLWWTLVWAFAATITCYFGGIFLALLINKKIVKGKTFWRTIFIISMAVPQFVSLLIMRNMFDIYGPINTFLSNTPIGKINFWDNQLYARILIIIINMWIGIPYTMVFSTGILQNIPEELYEAAYIEGSSKFHAFVKITMPYLLFMTGPVIITSVVSNINNFNVIFLLTGGKPLGVGLQYAGGTDILITWLYKLTMQNRLYNMGAAIGIIMFIISAVLSLSVYRRTSSYKNTGDFA